MICHVIDIRNHRPFAFGDATFKQSLLSKQHHINRVGHQIPFPQTSRFGDKAIKPLKPALLHPGWGHFLHASMEVERCADAQLNRADRIAMLEGKVLLLGTADANEE